MNQQERRRQRSRSRDRSNSPEKGPRNRYDEQDQQQFQANQEIIRSLLRIQQSREQPIDKFVKVVWIYKGKFQYDSKIQEVMIDPRIFLNKLTINQIQELFPSMENIQRAEKKMNSGFIKYWQSLKVVARAVLSNKKGQSAIDQAFRAQVDQILNKPQQELIKMEKVIETTLANRGDSGNAFWNCVKLKIDQKRKESQLSKVYQNFRENYKQRQAKQQEQQEIQDQEPISPPLGPVSLVNPKLITTQQDQRQERQNLAQKIFKGQFEKCREKLEENLSLPKNHNLLNTSIVSEISSSYDIITQQIIQFQKYKRMQQDEQQFDDWVPCQTEGRFRDRKPQYINRKRVKIQWNKYNTMHYTDDDPPPKTIQGYKFNIFYPDLYDKLKTPQYYLEATQSPDYCIIIFKAGPPYKDLAFKILRREWDFTQKSGFQSIFHRGILQLYFNYKKPKFRI